MTDHDDMVPAEEPEPADPRSDGAIEEALVADAEAVAETVDPGAHGASGTDPDFTPEQLDALVAERDQFLEAYQRTAADFDNFRKQVQKRIADEVARSQGAFVERLLPVLDAIEAARAHAKGEEVEGIEAVAGQLFGFLEKEGLSRVHPEGEEFDPNVAEAVMHEPGEGEPVVTEVLRTGYLWNGRVLRAAMVKVAG